MTSRLKTLVAFLMGLCLACSLASRANAYTATMRTSAGGEVIDWVIQGIPQSSIFSSNTPCGYRADTNYWTCEYGLLDAPYGWPLDFTISISPTQAPTYPALRLYYSGATDYPYNLISQTGGIGTGLLSINSYFYIPASAQKFRILYSNTGSGAGTTNIQINITFANYDPTRANMFGGKEINDDTEYCDEDGQPGKPRSKKFNNKKGAGPGKCAKQGLPTYSVNTASLSLVVSDTDLAYGGLGPPVAMTRTYNSNTPSDIAGVTVPSMFGNGWGFSYDEDIYYGCLGPGVHQGSGNTLVFSGSMCDVNPSTRVVSPPEGNFDSLRVLLNAADNTEYWLYDNKQSRLQYRYEWVYASQSLVGLKLVSITDRNGLVLKISRHTTNGQIQTVTDAAGRVTTFAYDANGRCISMSTPNGKTASYAYDAKGNLVTSTDLMGNVTNYAYDADNYLVSMQLGDKTTLFTYDASVTPKRIATVTNALGQTQTYQRSGINETTLTGATGNASVYRADDKGKTVASLDANGNSAGSSVFTAGLLTNYVSPGGWTKGYTYDGRGNILTTTRSSSYGPEVTSFSYDSKNNLLSKTDPQNPSWIWRYEYDANSNRTKTTTPLGYATRFAYTNGLLTAVTDANGHTSTYAYDGFGNNTSSRDALGNTVIRSYDMIGNLLTETDPAGNQTSYQYDANRRLTRVTHADGSYRTLTYDCCVLIGTTDENNHASLITNNKLLKPTNLIDPLAFVTHFDYDANNALVSKTLPDNSTLTYANDKLQRPTVTTNALGKSQTVTYDGDWNIASLTDERGYTTDFYFENGRPTGVVEPQSSDPATPRNRLISKWDKAGRLQIWINSRWDGLSFTYTPEGQIASKNNYSTALPIASYSYDSVGNVVQMVDAWGTTTFAYDAVGNNTSIGYPSGKALNMSYLATSRINQMSYPTGVVVSYSYDNRNRVKGMTFNGKSLIFSYDNVGNLLSETRSNGTTSTYSYDARNLVSDISHVRGSTVFSHAAFTRNAMGSITQETGFQPLAPALTSASVTAGYNHVNQVASWNSDAFVYDLDGNLVKVSGSRSLDATYDNENRLTSLTRGGVANSFTYDGNGRRVKTQTGVATIQSHYDRLGRLLFQTDGANQVTASYFYSGNRLVAMSTPAGGYYFYHYGKNGNTIALTDSSGATVVSYAYLPFGESRKHVTGAEVANPFTYVGAYGVQHDGDGIYLMSSRSYDAISGKFLQKDRIGFADGSNLYAYTKNNPLNLIDPEGTQSSYANKRSVGGSNVMVGLFGGILGLGFGNPVGAVLGAGKACLGAYQILSAEWDSWHGREDPMFSDDNAIWGLVPAGGTIKGVLDNIKPTKLEPRNEDDGPGIADETRSLYYED